MRVVQMTLDPELVAAVDSLAAEMKTSRSAFTRDALRAAVERQRIIRLEKRHQDGYERSPVQAGEFMTWDDEEVEDAESW